MKKFSEQFVKEDEGGGGEGGGADPSNTTASMATTGLQAKKKKPRGSFGEQSFFNSVFDRMFANVKNPKAPK